MVNAYRLHYTGYFAPLLSSGVFLTLKNLLKNSTFRYTLFYRNDANEYQAETS